MRWLQTLVITSRLNYAASATFDLCPAAALGSHLVHPEQDAKDPAERCRGGEKKSPKKLPIFLSSSGGLLSCVHTKLDESLFSTKSPFMQIHVRAEHWNVLARGFSALALGLTVNAFLPGTETGERE